VEFAYKAKVELLRELQDHFITQAFDWIKDQKENQENLLFVSFEQVSKVEEKQ
jgi:hypothetical protein